MGSRIRTILIEDSVFMRKVISYIISMDADIDLVGTASNGKEGSDMAFSLKPDVIITDMVMPDYDGMYVVKSVMEHQPVPIILLSALEKSDTRIFDALEHGAFEFIDKPTNLNGEKFKDYPLLPLIKEASRTDISLLKSRQQAKQKISQPVLTGKTNYEIVVMGASTGGPAALESILTSLPKDLTVPVVIAQHMPSRFLETFALRLNEHGLLSVKLAKKGELLKGGMAYIVPGDTNTRIEFSALHKAPMITFSNEVYGEFNNPSIDCLFESVAKVYGSKSIGIILTGMGKDGTAGMAAIKNSGGMTVAQDERSSVVFGMPKSAVDAGVVKAVMPLRDIPDFIVGCL